MTVQIEQLEPNIREAFVTAGGPGGQNVNKVATAVHLRFDLEASDAFTDFQKRRIRQKLERRLNADGEIVVFAQNHRTQRLNRDEARNRLVDWLTEALHRPKFRVATRPTKASKERRLKSKAKRSQVKAKRGRVRDE